jgi:hypothetical protein
MSSVAFAFAISATVRIPGEGLLGRAALSPCRLSAMFAIAKAIDQVSLGTQHLHSSEFDEAQTR